MRSSGSPARSARSARSAIRNPQSAMVRPLAIDPARRGCHLLVSNSTAKAIIAVYDDNADARDAGLLAHRVRARRTINSKPSRRGPIFEYVIVAEHAIR